MRRIVGICYTHKGKVGREVYYDDSSPSTYAVQLGTGLLQ